MTTWLNHDPDGEADTLPGKERRGMLVKVRRMIRPVRSFRGVRFVKLIFLGPFLSDTVLDASFSRERSIQCRSEEPDSFDVSEFPGIYLIV
jgi:hypothetical protein